MSHGQRPWMKWYPSDWRAEPGLRMCSFAARGIWADMLALMHEAEPYGHLLVNGINPNFRQLAALLGGSEGEVGELISELEAAGVFSRTHDGIIISRRMLRDELKRVQDRTNGARGGNPSLKPSVNGGVNPPDNGVDKAHMPEARYQKDPSSSLRSEEATPGNLDPRTMLFRQGLAELAAVSGRPETKLRPMVGRWLRDTNDDALQVLGLISKAKQDRPAEPIAWIEGHLKRATGPPRARRTDAYGQEL